MANKTPNRNSRAALAKALGQRLRAAREAKGLSRKEVADLMGWGISRVRDYEIGDTEPGVIGTQELAELFGVDVLKLAYGPLAHLGIDGEVRLPEVSGGEVTIQSHLLEGCAGPFVAVRLNSTAGYATKPGETLVVQPEAELVDGDAWLVDRHAGYQIGLLRFQSLKSLTLQIDLDGRALPVKRASLVGKMVASTIKWPR